MQPAFVLPLLAILATLLIARAEAQDVLRRGRAFLERHWPTAGAALLMLAGLYAVMLGRTGLIASGHGETAQAIGQIRRPVNP